MGNKYKFSILENEINIRLDVFLTLKLENFSRSHVQSLIKNNCVGVNKRFVKASYTTKRGDQIEVKIPQLQKLSVKAENIPINIVYEDNEIIVVNKPQQMVVHPGAGNISGTLVNALLFHCKNLSGINGILRSGIVHRIDKNTSGIIVIAKNDNAHIFLSKQFANHTIDREYIAIVHGNMYGSGVINKPIGRNPHNRKKMSVNKNGRIAITNYNTLENFNCYTLIKVVLETGRTHQIRVHMASINHPVLGDDVYGKPDTKFDLIGQVLHAGTLGFIHPATRKYIRFEQEPPQYFLDLIKKLRMQRR